MNELKKKKDGKVLQKKTAGTPDKNVVLADLPDDNVDPYGTCLTPAYGESVGLNTGAECDDGRGAE